MSSARIAYQARFVFPVITPPLPDGVVTAEGDRIVAVGDRRDVDCEIVELGNVALTPGLVNAHTHLELSDIRRPLGSPAMAFPDWIREVLAFRRRRIAASASPIQQGLKEVAASGTTLLGEIAQPDWLADAFRSAPLDAIVFLEAIGLSAERFEPKLAEAREHLAQSGHCQVGLSPHAPYTVHIELFDSLLKLAAERRAPIAFHLAESPEELQLLGMGDGPFRQLLEDLGVWNAEAIPRGARPLDYLRRLAACSARSLVIHGNYLDAEEIAFTANNRRTLSVVYCPRTHAYFGHARHPLPQLLAAGANVTLGTDSRASNPDLSVLEEMKFVRASFPELSGAAILELSTLRGAEALGQRDLCGSIEAGKLANLAILPLPDRDAANPHELLFEGPVSGIKTIYRGNAAAGV